MLPLAITCEAFFKLRKIHFVIFPILNNDYYWKMHNLGNEGFMEFVENSKQYRRFFANPLLHVSS